jgi:AraC-like DNA-binding protein
MQQFISNITFGAILLLVFLLLANPRQANVAGNRWLAFFFFNMLFFFIDGDFLINGHPHEYKYRILFFLVSFQLFCSPALYLSVSYYVSLNRKRKKIDLLHLVPVLAGNLLIYYFFIFNKNISPNETDKNILSITFILICILWIQMIIYLILSFRKIQKHQRQIKLFNSSTSNIDLQWLKIFLIGVLFLLILWILEVFVANLIFTYLIDFAHLITIFVISYYAIRQEEIFPFTESEKEEINEIIEESSGLIKKQKLSEEELETLKIALIESMTIDKLYLDDSLSLPRLASHLDISVHKLSRLLNEGIGQNFFQFVNSYRVEEAKNLLLNDDSKQLNMLGIAFEAGFNSKSTFNLAFKKTLGISPSEFLAEEMLKNQP